MLTARGRIACVFLVLCFGFTGCGSKQTTMSKTEYGSALSQAVAPANIKVRKLSFAVSRAPTLRLARTRVATIRATLDTAAKRVDDLRPPKDAEHANARIASGLRDLAAKANSLASGADAHTLRPLSGFDEELSQSTGATKVRDGLHDLTARGYALSVR